MITVTADTENLEMDANAGYVLVWLVRRNISEEIVRQLLSRLKSPPFA